MDNDNWITFPDYFASKYCIEDRKKNKAIRNRKLATMMSVKNKKKIKDAVLIQKGNLHIKKKNVKIQ